VWGEGFADEPAAIKFVEEFSKTLVTDFHHLTYEGILEIVINFDEWGWVIKSLPTRSYLVSGTPVKAKKPLRARVTVLMGCSASGLKFKPLVIGKSLRPRCFNNVHRNNLPVLYYQQKSAWMTADLFTQYFHELIVPTIKAEYGDRKVIVTMDNASCHPPTLKDIDNNIIVQFLPPNTTSLIQPMDQQVIFSVKSQLKANYFCKLLNSL
ncbi:unnamed protein product, partial [Meganyctiphanes norvegica]